jgi:FKBP-type peptidyl-prolyl cis-trans isomerase
MHWFNDRSETQDNLVPMLTSTVATKYQLFSMDDDKLDSSEGLDDGLFFTKVSSVIDGWQIALMNMHVGDTVQIVIPYQSAYGGISQGRIQPYSALRFNVRLSDIPAYEVQP